MNNGVQQDESLPGETITHPPPPPLLLEQALICQFHSSPCFSLLKFGKTQGFMSFQLSSLFFLSFCSAALQQLRPRLHLTLITKGLNKRRPARHTHMLGPPRLTAITIIHKMSKQTSLTISRSEPGSAVNVTGATMSE